MSADDVKADGDIITAQGNAFMLYGDVYMVAHKIIYNKQTKIAHLEGGVKIYQNNIMYLDVEQIDMRLEDKHTSMESLYMQSSMGMWVMAKNGEGNEGVYTFRRAVISGCDIVYPLWHLNVSSGTYDTNKEYISVWNSRFYLWGTPVFYLPYFYAPTGTKRTTGLLTPQISFSNKQGFMYMQPLFIAPSERWDITLSPQIRTNRGFGGEFEFRFADKNNSVAILQTRYFRNNEEYTLLNNLKNQQIYGGTLKYNTSNIFTSHHDMSSLKDGFFIDITYMNDLEYMRLKSLNAAFNTRLYESRINYFLNSEKHFAGIYAKYYLDLSKVSNSDTFQALPQIQYHHYTDSLLFKNLLYTFDIQSKNITRPSGYGYWQNTMSLPIGIATPILKDYVSIGANIEMYGTTIALQNARGVIDALQTPIDKSINYGTASYNLSLNSDIARPYKKFFHSLHLEAIFSGALYKYTSDYVSDDRYEAYNALLNAGGNSTLIDAYNNGLVWNPSDVVDVVKNKHKVDIKVSQYFYGKNGKELFYWRIYQRLFLHDTFLTRNQALRQEFGFSPLDGLTLSGSVSYSFLRSSVSEASINASFNRAGFDTNMTYYFKLDPLFLSSGVYGTTQNDTGFLNGNMSYDFGYFRINGNVGYDVGLGYMRNWYVVISKDIRCFGIGLKFAQDIRPTLTANNDITPIPNQYVKIEFRFVPLANTGFTYRFKE